MKTVRVLGKEYGLHSVTGQVVRATKNWETEVRGGDGANASVTTSAVTTVHDEFFLTDNSGREHAFQLTDVNVACRETNKLTVVWAIKRGQERGHCIAVRNHTTGQTFYSQGAINDICIADWRKFQIFGLGCGCPIFVVFSALIVSSLSSFVQLFTSEQISGGLTKGASLGCAAVALTIVVCLTVAIWMSKASYQAIKRLKSEVDFG